MGKEFNLKNFIHRTLKEFLSESLKYNGNDILQNDEISC